MKCPQCQAEIQETSKFCNSCGVTIEKQRKVCPKCGRSGFALDAKFCPVDGSVLDGTESFVSSQKQGINAADQVYSLKEQKTSGAPKPNKTLFNYYIDALTKYAEFSGRATRREYWSFVLVNSLVPVVIALISAILEIGDGLLNLYALGVMLPSTAVGVRRLHDTNRSGWWLLLPIGNIVFLAEEGNKGDNTYGQGA